MAKATAKLDPKMTFRVWRESEQRWYTPRQLRRKVFIDGLKAAWRGDQHKPN